MPQNTSQNIPQNTGEVFIYWDNSNIFISAQEVAHEREGSGANQRVRIEFKNLFELARAGRQVTHAFAVGSVPPSLEHLWNKLSQQGVEVDLSERGSESNTEQRVDETLQNVMLRDALIHNGNPGIVVLLTGDGKGYYSGKGFHKTVELMHKKGWRIEILSWKSSCHKFMLDWVNKNGIFIALDDFYDAITRTESRREDDPPPRHATELDLRKRPLSAV